MTAPPNDGRQKMAVIWDRSIEGMWSFLSGKDLSRCPLEMPAAFIALSPQHLVSLKVSRSSPLTS